MTPSANGNRVFSSRPDFPAGHFVCRDRRWPAILLGLALLALAGLLAREADSADAEGAANLLGAALVLAIAALISLLDRPAPRFVCTADGLYFPALDHAGWLHVPWCNVLDYRSQRLLDETSRLGLALALWVSPEEEAAYLAPWRLFGSHRLADGDKHPCRIGFTFHSLAADDIGRILRHHENAGRAFNRTPPPASRLCNIGGA